MSNIRDSFRRVDASTWIAFLSLLFSIPAIILSISQWHAQRNYDSAKETVEYLEVLQDARESIRSMKDSLSTVNSNNIDPSGYSDLRDELDTWASIYDKWFHEYSSNEPVNPADRHLLTGILRLQIRVLQSKFDKSISKPQNGEQGGPGYPPQSVGSPDP